MTKCSIFSPGTWKLEPDCNNGCRKDKEDEIDMKNKRDRVGELDNIHPQIVQSSPGANFHNSSHDVDRNNCLHAEDVRKTHPCRGVSHSKGHKWSCNMDKFTHDKVDLIIRYSALR